MNGSVQYLSKHKTSRTLMQTLLAVLVLAGFVAQPVSAQEMMPPTSVPVAPIDFDAVYVVNGGDGMTGSISVIDARYNKVRRTIVLENAMWPHHIYLSPDGTKFAVAVPGMDLSMGHDQEMPEGMMGAVIVLNARNGATLNSRMLPAMNHNATFTLNQREIWTTQMKMMEPGSVLVLDANTLETRAEIPVGMMPAEVTITPSGAQAYVANGDSNSVSVIDVRSRMVVAEIPVGESPVVPSHGMNGHTYVDNEHSMTVSAIDRRHQHVDFEYNLGFTPAYAKLGPDGNVWITDTDNGRVGIYSQFRDQRLALITVGAGAHAIEFSPDGERAYITNQFANSVSVIDVDARRVIATVPVGEKPNGVVFRRAPRWQ